MSDGAETAIAARKMGLRAISGNIVVAAAFALAAGASQAGPITDAPPVLTGEVEHTRVLLVGPDEELPLPSSAAALARPVDRKATAEYRRKAAVVMATAVQPPPRTSTSVVANEATKGPSPLPNRIIGKMNTAARRVESSLTISAIWKACAAAAALEKMQTANINAVGNPDRMASAMNPVCAATSARRVGHFAMFGTNHAESHAASTWLARLAEKATPTTDGLNPC